MNVFSFTLSSNSSTTVVIVGAESRERAIELLQKEYKLIDAEDIYSPGNEDAVSIYRDNELSKAEATEEFVTEVF
jgi:hypothetical protein